LRENFKQVVLPQVFKKSNKAINKMPYGTEWLTEKQTEEILMVSSKNSSIDVILNLQINT